MDNIDFIVYRDVRGIGSNQHRWIWIYQIL